MTARSPAPPGKLPAIADQHPDSRRPGIRRRPEVRNGPRTLSILIMLRGTAVRGWPWRADRRAREWEVPAYPKPDLAAAGVS